VTMLASAVVLLRTKYRDVTSGVGIVLYWGWKHAMLGLHRTGLVGGRRLARQLETAEVIHPMAKEGSQNRDHIPIADVR
jgi:hypothetical protein